MFKSETIFKSDFSKIQKVTIPAKAVMAVLIYFGAYMLITFYDLLERIINTIEVNICVLGERK